MKTLLFSLFATFFAASALSAQEVTSLPFSVKFGGQAATYKKGEAFAKVEQPVATNAELSVETKDSTVIVNAVKASAKGEPVAGAQPAVILLQNTSKTTLDKTLDGKKLDPGTYLFSVVAGGQTASIIVTLK
jgi:hypothetical protein